MDEAGDTTMTFRVGQKVVRVTSNSKTFEREWLKAGYNFSYPEIGEVVTIKTINHWPHEVLVTLCEHDNSHMVGIVSKLEPGFAARHFRPIVERKTSIEIFTRMLTDQKVNA